MSSANEIAIYEVLNGAIGKVGDRSQNANLKHLHQPLEVCGKRLCSTHRIDSLDAHSPFPVAGVVVVVQWQNVGILKIDCLRT